MLDYHIFANTYYNKNMKHYTRMQVVLAEPCDLKSYEAKTGKNPMKDKVGDSNMPGYVVINANGFSRWVEKETVEKSFAPSETAKERLNIEIAEVSQRLEALDKFIVSDEFKKLPDDVRDLLIIQNHSMATYAGVAMVRYQKI